MYKPNTHIKFKTIEGVIQVQPTLLDITLTAGILLGIYTVIYVVIQLIHLYSH